MQVYVLNWSKNYGHFSKCTLVYLFFGLLTYLLILSNNKKKPKPNININYCLSVPVGLMYIMTYYNQINRSKSCGLTGSSLIYQFSSIILHLCGEIKLWWKMLNFSYLSPLVSKKKKNRWANKYLYHTSLWLVSAFHTHSPTETDSGLGLVVWSVPEFDWQLLNKLKWTKTKPIALEFFSLSWKQVRCEGILNSYQSPFSADASIRLRIISL